MTQTEEFNPIETARKVEESYREYIATTIHFADADLQSQLEEILRKPGYLAKGPFLEAAPPYRKDKTVTELVGEGVLCESMLKLGGGDADNFDLGKWFRFEVELILESGKTTRSTPFCTFFALLLGQSSLSAQRVKTRARCAGSLAGCRIEGLRDQDSVLKYATSN